MVAAIINNERLKRLPRHQGTQDGDLIAGAWRPFFMPNDMAPRPLRDQTAARIHPPSKTGRPTLPATSFFRLDARQVFCAIMVAMPRDGAIIFSDLIVKLDLLRVTCEKCGRDGCYGLSRLIDKRGHDGKVIDWLDEIDR